MIKPELLQGLCTLNAGYTEERCGLLIQFGRTIIAHNIPNIHSEPEHFFSMEMNDVMKVVRSGVVVVGMYHTHTNNKYWPSEDDIDGYPHQLAEMMCGPDYSSIFEAYLLWVPRESEDRMVVRYWPDGSTKPVWANNAERVHPEARNIT